MRAFIAAPGRLRELNASCARKTPEVRVVGGFPRWLAGMTPAAATAGNRAGRAARQLAAVGAEATGDAEWRWYYGDGVRGWGLRGGTYGYAGPARATRITFRKVRWTADTAVSGHATWNIDTGRMTAWLTVTGPGRRRPGGRSARIRLSYSDYTRHPAATISGSCRGRRILASMPAP